MWGFSKSLLIFYNLFNHYKEENYLYDRLPIHHLGEI